MSVTSRHIAPACARAMIAGAVVALAPALAAAPLEQVIVSAQKREQSLQDTPIAISTMNAAQLEAQGIGSLDALGEGAIPSLRVMPFPTSSSTLVMTIRGNGPLDIAQITREGSVAIYLDGIYLGRAQGFAAEYADLERIEVLRGPQGTLFGRNSTGGAVSLVSRRPGADFAFTQTLGVGRFDERRSVTRLNLPETGGVRAKFDYLHSERDGWVKNPAPGAADYNAYSKDGGRLSLGWNIGADIAANYHYDRSKIRTTQNYFQLYEDNIGIIGVEPGRRDKTRFAIAPLQPTVTVQDLHVLDLSWSPAPSFTLKSLSAYRELDDDNNNNFGGALYRNGVIVHSAVTQRQFSQELQLIGTQPSLQWVAGLFYFTETADEELHHLFSLDIFGVLPGNAPKTPIVPPTDFDLSMGVTVPPRYIHAHLKSTALYGQATWTPPLWGERLHLTLGARYTRDRKSGSRYDIGYNRFELDTENVDPLVTVEYTWSEYLTSYVKWSSAYKAGGANSRTVAFSAYDAERVSTWELGVKSECWNQRLRLNAAVFTTAYDDMQIDVIDPTNIVVSETINAPRSATVEGAEFDLDLALWQGLIAGISYTYLEGDMPLQPNPLAGGAPTRFQITQTPRHAGALSLDYTFAPLPFGTLVAHVDATSTARYAYVALGDQHKDAYTLFNARLSLADIALGTEPGTLKISAWGKNLSDEDYVIFSNPLGEPPLAITQVFGTPRTFGVDVTYQY